MAPGHHAEGHLDQPPKGYDMTTTRIIFEATVQIARNFWPIIALVGVAIIVGRRRA